MIDLPDASILHNIFLYNPESGILTNKGGRTKRGCTRPVGREAGTLSTNGYRNVSINGRLFRAHRVIWTMVYGQAPKDFIDHKNGVRDDNRLVNLRECDRHENQTNTKRMSRNKSGFKGVSKGKSRKNPWMAFIAYRGKQCYLGSFKSPEEAHAAYCEFAIQIHGEFANFG
jgi:hypothetical protein